MKFLCEGCGKGVTNVIQDKRGRNFCSAECRQLKCLICHIIVNENYIVFKDQVFCSGKCNEQFKKWYCF